MEAPVFTAADVGVGSMQPAGRSTGSRNCFSAGGRPAPLSISGPWPASSSPSKAGRGPANRPRSGGSPARLAEQGITVVDDARAGRHPAGRGDPQGSSSPARPRRSGAEAEALLFAAARADHVDRLIRPALAAGDWVLCDRFSDSTRVYQGAIGGVDGATLDALERVAVGRSRPDLTIILDVPAEVGLRAGRGPPRRDRRRRPTASRARTIDLHERRRQAFLDIAGGEPGPLRGHRRRPRRGGRVADDIWRAVAGRLLRQAA